MRQRARMLKRLGLAKAPKPAAPIDEAHPVRIRVSPARRGFVHPLTRRDVSEALAFFGPLATYGLRSVEMRHALDKDSLVLARLRVPGVVVLYEQPQAPWVIQGQLTEPAFNRLERAGAVLQISSSWTRVDWPGETMDDFMLFDGLMHEIGHHLIQHHTGKRTARVLRTPDHERRAQDFAAACREAWESRSKAS